MRVFKTKWFARFARKESIGDKALAAAIACAERGLMDAKLRGDLIKQRIARPGSGKRGGFRVLIGYRAGERAIFLLGFAKNNQANISREDERDLKDYGALLLSLKDQEIERMIEGGELMEVIYGEEFERVSQ